MKPYALTLIYRALFVLSAWFLSFGVQADTWQECSGPYPMGYSRDLPANAGRDAQIGDAIGDRLIVRIVDWPCTFYSDDSGFVVDQETRVTFTLTGAISVWGATPGGETIFSVNHNGKNLGITLGLYLDNPTQGGNQAIELNSLSGEYIFPNNQSGTPQQNGKKVAYRVVIRMQPFKISDDFPSEQIEFTINPVQINIKTARVNDLNQNSQDVHNPYTSNIKVYAEGNLSCTITPLPVINLGSRKVQNLQHSSAPFNYPQDSHSTKVSLKFNCPSNLLAMRYKITPIPSGADISNGVLPLITPSTAANVGVQVFDIDINSGATGSPINFANPWKRIKEPYKGNNTSRMDFAARIVRLHQGILPTAGTVHAGMKVMATYH